MKLRYDRFNAEYVVEPCKITAIVIESPHTFDSVFTELHQTYETDNGPFHLIQSGKEIKLSKGLDILFSPLSINYTSTLVKKRFLKYLIEEVDSSELDHTFLTTSFAELLNEMQIKSLFEFDYEPQVYLEDILKLYKVALADPEGAFVERVIEYMKTMSGLTGLNTFMIVNCACYMDEEDITFLQKNIENENFGFLMLESRQPEFLPKGSQQYIIDKGSCEINSIESHMESDCGESIFSEIII